MQQGFQFSKVPRGIRFLLGILGRGFVFCRGRLLFCRFGRCFPLWQERFLFIFLSDGFFRRFFLFGLTGVQGDFNLPEKQINLRALLSVYSADSQREQAEKNQYPGDNQPKHSLALLCRFFPFLLRYHRLAQIHLLNLRQLLQ